MDVIQGNQHIIRKL